MRLPLPALLLALSLVAPSQALATTLVPLDIGLTVTGAYGSISDSSGSTPIACSAAVCPWTRGAGSGSFSLTKDGPSVLGRSIGTLPAGNGSAGVVWNGEISLLVPHYGQPLTSVFLKVTSTGTSDGSAAGSYSFNHYVSQVLGSNVTESHSARPTCCSRRRPAS